MESNNSESEEKINLDHLPVHIRRLIKAALVISVSALGFYIYTFFGNPIGNSSDFAYFGSYIGGVLTPLFTLLMVSLLIWSIRIQIIELKKSTAALDSSQRAQHEAKEIQRKEVLRKQVQDNLEYHLAQYREKFRHPVIEFGGKKYSIESILSSSDERVMQFGERLIKSIGNRMEDESYKDPFTCQLIEMRQHIFRASKAMRELLEYLDSEVIITSLSEQVSVIITGAESLGILTEDEKKLMRSYFAPHPKHYPL